MATVTVPAAAVHAKLQTLAYDTYYLSYREEVAAGRIVGFWQVVDEVTKILVAITASSSAVAGWTLWNDPKWRSAWGIMAGLGAMLSVIHASLRVPDRIKTWTEAKQIFSRLRIDLQTFRQRMQLNDPNDSKVVQVLVSQFAKLRVRFASGMDKKRNDLLQTRSFLKSVDAEVDDLMEKELPLESVPIQTASHHFATV